MVYIADLMSIFLFGLYIKVVGYTKSVKIIVNTITSPSSNYTLVEIREMYFYIIFCKILVSLVRDMLDTC